MLVLLVPVLGLDHQLELAELMLLVRQLELIQALVQGWSR
jgi:hypothetical protein